MINANKILGRVLIVLALITLNFVGWNQCSELLTAVSTMANTIGWLGLILIASIDIWSVLKLYNLWIVKPKESDE